MLEKIALALNRALVVRGEDASLRAPGARRVLRCVEADGREFTIVSHGEAFEVIYGRRTFNAFAVSSSSVVKLLRFLIRWWIFGTWCGLKTWLWDWSVSALIDAEQKRMREKL